MKENYKTLDEYLDTLDSIKERIAEETEGMNLVRVMKYFAAAALTLQEATGQTVRVRSQRRRRSKAKP
jgi:hypothetical protein